MKLVFAFSRQGVSTLVDPKGIVAPRIPVSTYRLQFNGQFRFFDARKIVPYLYELGISDVYASPYLKARSGSMHGYDIVDPRVLNLEVGTEAEYDAFVKELTQRGMGQVLDIVPNHMCIESHENAWWADVLENGPSSLYAKFFDINWQPTKKELTNKVLLPVLGDQFGNVLEKQELTVAFDEQGFSVSYFAHRFPLCPDTYGAILEPGLDELRKSLDENDPFLVELLSIITALRHLPPYRETDPEKMTERHREKEIIKKRLWGIAGDDTKIRRFIDGNLRFFNGEKGNPQSFDMLEALLENQVYRLSFWRVAADEINYRRFFDINGLGAIRMEDPAVFEASHELVWELIREGHATGLRVDHPDGLYDPAAYFQQLQRNCFLHRTLSERSGGERGDTDSAHDPSAKAILDCYDDLLKENPHYRPFYIVGEKILIKSEKIPDDWPVFGTTGYDFMNLVNGVFVDTGNAKAIDSAYSRFIGERWNFPEIALQKKRLIMQTSMSSEIHMLGHYLNAISGKNRHTVDFTLNSLIDAIAEVIAFFPVYRTYVVSLDVTDRDRQYIELAVTKAKKRNPAINESIYDFLKNVLLLHVPENASDEEKQEWLDFVMRFQQITGPVMAKGMEDTAFYLYNRLASLNEVGGSPERLGIPLEAFHGQNIERSKFWPHALLATSTHDSKRSEDVRARINVLSELPDRWKEYLIRWTRLNKKKTLMVDNQTAPDRNEEYLLYQTLIGAWPLEALTAPEYSVFVGRIKEYLVKALREAKVNSSWINPNISYEEAVQTFVERLLKPGDGNAFLNDVLPLQQEIAVYGIYNSLSQTLLKMTAPGIPDFYQGTELWDFSLVDPDNRRSVDYEKRITMLDELRRRAAELSKEDLSRELTENKKNGMIKLYLIFSLLQYRMHNRDIFDRGEYLPLETAGEGAPHVCAFARILDNAVFISACPRFLTKLVGPETLPLGKEVWKDTHIVLPVDRTGAHFRNILTGEQLTASERSGSDVLALADLFANFPVAALERTA